MEGRARHLQLIKNLLDTGGSFVYSVYIEGFSRWKMGSNGYCREAEYRGHVVDPETYCCGLCGLMQNAWLGVDRDCPKHIPAPPWATIWGVVPEPNKAFCPGDGTHNMSKSKTLHDYDRVICTAIQVGFGCVGITASKATGDDLYKCSHCHNTFVSPCTHGMF